MVEISTLKQSSSIHVAVFSPVYFVKFAKNTSLGPPYSLQLSMHTTVALLPYIAEHTELPFQGPISKYLASGVFRRLL